MKRFCSGFLNLLFIVILYFTLFSESIFGQETVDSTRTVRVLSYNIFHGATMKGDFDLDLIAKVILSVSPDIVALQEVDYKTNRVKKMDLVTELGYRTGMSPLFGRAMKYDDGEYGEGILSRYTFIRTKNQSLPFSPGKEPRTALEVKIQLHSGDEIVFIGTHLDHTKDPVDRLAQAKQINKIFRDNPLPMILAGDLNAIPGSRTMEVLSGLWSDACFNNPVPTYPSSNPKKRIDYVMFKPANRWRIIETKVVDEKIASDHCPLLVVLELLPENGQ